MLSSFTDDAVDTFLGRHMKGAVIFPVKFIKMQLTLHISSNVVDIYVIWRFDVICFNGLQNLHLEKKGLILD